MSSFDNWENTLSHHGTKGQQWGVRNGPPYPLKPDFENLQSLSNHMKSFKYKEFDKLMSPNEVASQKSGSCHDQVMYEFQQLQRMGLNPKGLFVIEHNKQSGGMTHSLVYYEKDGKTHWFENAWSNRAGDTAYNSLNAIKREIKKAHSSGEYGANKDYPNLEFGVFDPSEHTVGESLQELVNRCLK